MTLVSQGIFLPKKQLAQHFSEAHTAFKYVAKYVRGQSFTQHFNDVALQMNQYALAMEQMTKAECLDALENLRHEYYAAAENIADQKATCRLLRRALATHDLIKKERSRG